MDLRYIKFKFALFKHLTMLIGTEFLLLSSWFLGGVGREGRGFE